MGKVITSIAPTSVDGQWRGWLTETLEDRLIAIAREVWEATDAPTYDAAVKAREATYQRERTYNAGLGYASAIEAAKTAEVDHAVVLGYALAMTAAESPRGLDAWMAAALAALGGPGAPTRTPFRMGEPER